MRRRKAASVETQNGLQRLRPNVAGIDLGAREHWVCGPERD